MKLWELLLKIISIFIGYTPDVDDTPSSEEEPKKITPPIKVRDDNNRLKEELRQLPDHNEKLHDLILDLQEFVYDRFNKELTITMIYRTQAEQDRIYANDPRYQERPFKSPHQFWHALDLRSFIFTADEIGQIEKFLNDKYEGRNHYQWTAKHYNMGLGDHFHIQLYEV